MKRIILCADDYGQNSTISQAIVELLKAKRLSATSCLVTSPQWAAHAKWLEPFKNKVDIGLHFNLTEGIPLSKELPAFFSLKELLIKSHLRKLDKQIIAAEFYAQLDQFVYTFGQLPDFVDGHQHVHQFPVIRDAILEIYEERLRANNIYLRCTYDSRMLVRIKDIAYFKQLFIQLCGGIDFKKELMKRQIPHNQTFSGIYQFSDSLDYQRLFPRFVNQIQDGGLIMCHPGLFASEAQDPIAGSRHNEYLYFDNIPFTDYCNNYEVKLVRFAEIDCNTN